MNERHRAEQHLLEGLLAQPHLRELYHENAEFRASVIGMVKIAPLLVETAAREAIKNSDRQREVAEMMRTGIWPVGTMPTDI